MPNEHQRKMSQLRCERLQTVGGRLKFQARLSARWIMVGQIEGKDTYRMWEMFKGGILGAAEEVCEKRKCRSGVKRSGW